MWKKADANDLTDNLILNSSGYGIAIIGGAKNRLQYNDVLDSDNTALRIINSSNNSITGNSFLRSRLGIEISTTPAVFNCTDNTEIISAFNIIEGNHVIDFDLGIALGNGSNNKFAVYKNQIHDNKIYDDELGIYFNSDSYGNDATRNAFQGTVTPVIDIGSSNTY